MAEWNEVLVFCALYSGVVLFSLVTTISQKVEVRVQAQKRPPLRLVK